MFVFWFVSFVLVTFLAPSSALRSNTKLRSSVYQKKLKNLGNFAPRTLTTFGFALTHWTDARRWTLTALRSGLDISNLVRSFKSGCDLL